MDLHSRSTIVHDKVLFYSATEHLLYWSWMYRQFWERYGFVCHINANKPLSSVCTCDIVVNLISKAQPAAMYIVHIPVLVKYYDGWLLTASFFCLLNANCQLVAIFCCNIFLLHEWTRYLYRWLPGQCVITTLHNSAWIIRL